MPMTGASTTAMASLGHCTPAGGEVVGSRTRGCLGRHALHVSGRELQSQGGNGYVGMNQCLNVPQSQVAPCHACPPRSSPQGVLTRPFVQLEAREALAQEKPVILVGWGGGYGRGTGAERTAWGRGLALGGTCTRHRANGRAPLLAFLCGAVTWS